MTSGPVLKIEDLHTYFYSRSKQAFIRSVDGVSLQIQGGKTLGVVGESGSGKSVTAMSVMGLAGGAPGVVAGKIGFKTAGIQKNLLQDIGDFVQLDRQGGKIMDIRIDNRGWQRQIDRNMRGIRGQEMAMIFQNPKLALNPFMTIGSQIEESILLNTAVGDARIAREQALHWLEQVKIDSPRIRYKNYPYGLSGGMCQRVMIAMGLSAEPALLIADEPTTGLDATIQSRIVDLLLEITATVGVTTMLISHDIDVIRTLADEVAVMYGGTILEHGTAAAVLGNAGSHGHPYTAALLASIPDQRQVREKAYLQAIKGEVLDTLNLPAGCRFYPRCERTNPGIKAQCAREEPDLRFLEDGHFVRCWLYD